MLINIDYYSNNITSNKAIETKYGSIWGRDSFTESKWTRLSGGFNIPEIPPEALPVTYLSSGEYVPGLTFGECYAFVVQDAGTLYLCYRSIRGFPAVEVCLKKAGGRLVFTPIEGNFWCHYKVCNPKHAKNWLVAPNGAIIGRTSHQGKKCEICQRTFVGADMHTISDEGVTGYVCPNCEYEMMEECSICGRSIFTHNAILDKETFKYICPTCNEEKECLPVHNYHLKPELIFYGNEDSLHMGIELEIGGTTGKMCNSARRKLNPLSRKEKLFHLESDSSIPDEGFELVTQPCTAEFHRNKFNWDAIMNILNKNEFTTGTTEHPCGMHIHMSRNYLSALRWCVFDWFVYHHRFAFEAIANRMGNRFAKFPNEENKKWGVNYYGRYEYLNFENDDTVEFRLCKSTLDAERLVNTVEFMDSVVNFIKYTKNLEPSLDEFEIFLKKEKPLVYEWYSKTVFKWYCDED